MSLSFHHQKCSTQLPLITHQNQSQNIKGDKKYKIVERKNPVKNNLSPQASPQIQIRLSHSLDNILSSNSQVLYTLKNQSSLKPCLHIPERYLVKNKKYYRTDARMKTKQNVIKNDIENIIETLVGQKQKNDRIMVNLRKDFINNKKKSQLQLNKLNLISNQGTPSSFQFNKKANCPISSVNNFSDPKGKKTIKYTDQVLNQNQDNFFGKNSALNLEIKNFKKTLKHYINKSQQSINNKLKQNIEERPTIKRNSCQVQKNNNFFKQFVKLSQQSYDFLEYYLKANYITEFSKKPQNLTDEGSILNYSKEEIEKVLKSLDKKVILSIFRSSQKSLQPAFNPEQIINRIILALNINPMNDFQFIKQETFTRLRRIMTEQSTRKESRQYLVKYFFLDSSQIRAEQFFSSLHTIFKKLNNILNLSTIAAIFFNFKEIVIESLKQFQRTQQNNNDNNQRDKKESMGVNQKTQQTEIKRQYYSKDQIKWLLSNDHMFVWDQILKLIFLI